MTAAACPPLTGRWSSGHEGRWVELAEHTDGEHLALSAPRLAKQEEWE